MIGYKSFDPNCKDQYGNSYEVGKKYHSVDSPNFGHSGFHFCSRPEDTLRYASSNQNFDIYLIEASGNIVLYNDEYYGYYDMYSSEYMRILRYVSRFEVVHGIVSSNNEDRINRLISLTKLSKDEIEYILKNTKSELVRNYISFYQLNDKDAFKRQLKRMN